MAQTHHHTSDHEDVGEVSRFGVSMSARLLEQFDALIAKQGYTNRSEAIRDLVRDRLVESEWESEKGHVVGALAMVYDHEMRLLNEKLTDLQHHSGHLVVSTLHVHLNVHDCLEVVVMMGQAQEVRDLANRLLSLRGVKHGKLMMTGLGEKIGV